MCLLIAAYEAHPDYRFVLVGHRDEFHVRPSAPLGWWADDARVLAGRDLQAGGTWLGVTREGRLGVVTNVRVPGEARPEAPSRGLLVTDFLRDDRPPQAFAARLATRADDYAGFNLLTYDGSSLAYCSNRPGPREQRLSPGIYGLSNAQLDTPWPKLVRARDRVRDVLRAGPLRPERLFAALADRRPASDDELPDTGIGTDLERLLSSPFVVSPDYGTRCTTLVLAGRDGTIRVEERRYAADGGTTGRTTIAFNTSRATAGGG
jgi:uncharacterized protein with NRDE domain